MAETCCWAIAGRCRRYSFQESLFQRRQYWMMSFGVWAKNTSAYSCRVIWVFARSRGSLTLCTMLAKFFIFSRISRSLMSFTVEVRWQSTTVYIQSGCSGGMWWSFARTKIRRIERIGQRSGWLSSLTRLRVWSTSEFLYVARLFQFWRYWKTIIWWLVLQRLCVHWQ